MNIKNNIINNKNSKIWFDLWLVGITDAEGTFGFYNQNGKWSLLYKIALSRYNLKTLYYIKKQLGIGSVTKDNNKAQFIIRDREKLAKFIFPLFDKYPLLTSKYFNYLKLKKAFLILNNTNLTKDEKDKELLFLKKELLPKNYISPALNHIKLPIKNTNCIKHIISKPWLVGFVEGEGSFYLVSKNSTRIVHGFGITQKLDSIVLEAIRSILGISTKVRKSKYNFYIIDTTNSRSIENIIKYFQNTMKGMKSVEYRIWARSYYKHKGNYIKLVKIRDIIRNIRKKLLDISVFQDIKK